MNAQQFTPFHDWKRDLLQRRGLTQPKGHPLYHYRLSEEEFSGLEQLLRTWLVKVSARVELDVVAARLSGFPALFVLFAAEWWRRRYDGPHWSWGPILNAIGANPDEWSQAQRSACVVRGLQDWGLKPREGGGLRFLGSIAVQGGLPLALLAQARGGIGQVLGRVLQLAGNSTAADLYSLGWVESLQAQLPKSYRQAAIFTLLSDVARTVLHLKEEAGLTSSAGAVAQLDQQLGTRWRERFPLPVDDLHAQGLIEQLIRDAASVRVEPQTTCLPLERRLEADGNGGWTLKSSLTLPDTIQASQLARLFGLQVEDLPRVAELALTAGNVCQTTALRRLAGHEAYRVERKPWGFSGVHAAYEHLLHLNAPDGRSWSATAAKGGALDEELPWVFSTEDGSYLRQGSGGVAANEAWLALPSNWRVMPPETASLLGDLASPGRKLFHICGDIQAVDGEGGTYRIRTGHAGAGEENYEWHGQRYWLDFLQPTMAFKGLPALYRSNPQGAASPVDGNPGWNPNGAAAAIGPVTARYPANGEIKYRARMVILPKEAELALDCRNARSGAIRLENWGAANARVLTPGIQQKLRSEDSALVLDLSLPADVHTPERVEIEVVWRQASARLALPFPAQGARAFDGTGKELASGAMLAAHLLAGLRIQVLGGRQNPRMTLELGMAGTKRIHPLHGLPGSLGLVIRLQDYAADIQHLLSTDDGPDAVVTAVVRIGGVEHFKLRLARYAARLEKSGGDIGLDKLDGIPPETLAAMPVLALRLERPGDEAIALPCRDSEGVASGMWDFLPATREPGAWLIYPGADAALPFRPTLWTVAGEVSTDSPLAQAIGIADPSEREAALDQVVAAMAADFLEPCWLEMERLAGQIGHLPLTTLDLWRRLARSPQGMAALALRFGTLPQGFLDRFEQELPFAWETISFVTWRRAMECLVRQCKGSFGEEAGTALFPIHLDARIKDLSANHGALAFLLGIASADFLLAAKRETQGLGFLGQQSAQQLFEGESSLSMKLRQRHADEQWPSGFNPILTPARSQTEVAGMLHPQVLGYPDGAINLPLLLAAQAATHQTENWFTHPAHIHVLRAHRAFDPDWFDEAYNLTIARCLADGLLEP
ncbi:MAG: STY4851/ECs_5259 family protein [Pseudomonadota bacterium]|nr:STY4851/ECs_5259 family protein [Pseudomonadota bacterium]